MAIKTATWLSNTNPSKNRPFVEQFAAPNIGAFVAKV